MTTYYTKNTPDWADYPSTTTPISAAKLTHIEDGIVAVDAARESMQSTVDGHSVTLAANAGTINTIQSAATALALRVTTAEGTIVSHTATLGTIGTRVTALEGGGSASLGACYWPGSAGVGTWPARPSVAAGVQVEWRSVLDTLAPPPPGAVAGDTWKRAPGSTA